MQKKLLSSLLWTGLLLTSSPTTVTEARLTTSDKPTATWELAFDRQGRLTTSKALIQKKVELANGTMARTKITYNDFHQIVFKAQADEDASTSDLYEYDKSGQISLIDRTMNSSLQPDVTRTSLIRYLKRDKMNRPVETTIHQTATLVPDTGPIEKFFTNTRETIQAFHTNGQPRVIERRVEKIDNKTITRLEETQRYDYDSKGRLAQTRTETWERVRDHTPVTDTFGQVHYKPKKGTRSRSFVRITPSTKEN